MTQFFLPGTKLAVAYVNRERILLHTALGLPFRLQFRNGGTLCILRACLYDASSPHPARLRGPAAGSGRAPLTAHTVNGQTALPAGEQYSDAAQPVARLTPCFHDIEIDHLTATGSQTAGVIIGLPESPGRNVVLTHVHIAAQTGMTISNATVKTNDLAITPASGPPMRLLENAVVKKQ